jgi:hypothetical protein
MANKWRDLFRITTLVTQPIVFGWYITRPVSITTNPTLSVRIMRKLRRSGRSDEWMTHLSIVFSRRANTTVFVSFHYVRTNKVSFDVRCFSASGVQYTYSHVRTDGVFSVGLFYVSSSAAQVIQRLLWDWWWIKTDEDVSDFALF